MRKYVFSDEAGNFDFSRKQGASKYYIICTVCMEQCDIGHDVLRLRRELVWEKLLDRDHLHATYDTHAVRQQVFDVIQGHRFRIDATILEKSKAQPQTRISDARFYKYAWFYHFSHVGPQLCGQRDELFVSPASIGTSTERAIYKACIDDCIEQSLVRGDWRACFWPSKADPCLQVADYCTWAIQRKWEANDERWYALIADRIATEFDLWRIGERHYY